MPKPSHPHQITILTALNGFKVQVGCAEILFTERGHLINELDRYLENPEKVEKEYTEKALYSEDAPRACEADRPPDNVEARTPRVTSGFSGSR